MTPLAGAWTQLLANIKTQVSPQSFETWFAPTKQVGDSDSSITIEVPNKFFKDWLLEHYKEHILRATQELNKGAFTVQFQVNTAPEPEEKSGEIEPQQQKKGLGFFERGLGMFAQPQEFAFNKRYSFDSFVVGSSNRFAHAASLAVAEKPAKAYNPLFIYGGVGLGKTHLMQAIGQYIVKKHPRTKVMYISSERFTNQLINAIQNRSTQKFREKYRHQDVLLIDDVQFISGKESTQEEFFHTFNVLYDSHKQIVVSSDKPPKEITALEKRLVSRFEWGLVTDIQPPDLETRIAILRQKREPGSAEIPDDVLFFIANNIKSNIRELEGALIRVVAYSSLVGQKIDLSIAKEVLKEVDEEKNSEINIELIQRVVADHFGVTTSDLRAKRRTRKIAYPRQVAMYLSREMTSLSLVEIGGLFGGKDHTTVIHAHGKVEEDVKNNPQTARLIENVISKIKTRG
ncbi:chromosomal replication initiator protein DnaA [Candidatus Omnitrophota bacterium]